jgi:hypothetical protein
MNKKDVHALNESYKATGEILNEEMYDCLRDGLSYAECCAQYPQECQQDQKSGVEEDKGGSPGRHPAKGIPFSDGKGEHAEEEPDFLRDVLGYEPEDFEGEDPDQAAMDRQDRESGDGAYNAMVETLEGINKHVKLNWAGFDESQEFLINDVMVKVVGFGPGSDFE